MALIPFLNELMYDYRQPATIGDLYDQHFGLGMEDFCIPSRSFANLPALRSGYLRPWRNLEAGESGISSITSDDKEFRVRLDVTHFKPEELKVKVDDNDYVVVEGKHEERNDQHGFISRQFTRRYKLPNNVEKESLASNLSSDGVLTLQAAKKPKLDQPGREIKIIKTNQPAIKKDAETPMEQGKVEKKK